jgi:hypothetical protein
MAIITASIFVILDYSSETGEIILTVDFNLNGWETTLFQIINKYKHFSRYESDF